LRYTSDGYYNFESYIQIKANCKTNIVSYNICPKSAAGNVGFQNYVDSWVQFAVTWNEGGYLLNNRAFGNYMSDAGGVFTQHANPSMWIIGLESYDTDHKVLVGNCF